ncbi:Diphthamide biosynthesis protein 1 [Diplonema papillatum]|nr:Diphthamide biosynthesis protein 1 [Diplonema papillatum]
MVEGKEPTKCCAAGNGSSQVVMRTDEDTGASSTVKKRVLRGRGTVPKEILEDEFLNGMIGQLPKHYTFEIHKTVWRVREAKSRRVALQFPEGLLLFAPLIASILEKSCNVTCVLLGDVTYGACCVDDWAARALGADFLVHYGHSCLISIRDCVVPNMMYVFVEIRVDVAHVCDTIRALIPKDKKVVLSATIQFASCLRAAAEELTKTHFASPPVVPQAKPLSSGEVLGCTSPKVPSCDSNSADTLIFLADGRFHMESLMIHNPHLQSYLYNPYTKELTSESYDHVRMKSNRLDQIAKARSCTQWGVILGTLGHQGSPAVLTRVEKILQSRGLDYVVVLLSEIFPMKLQLFEGVGAWVQISCPRLSIDWGMHFSTPLLTPFELEVCMGTAVMPSVYPMDWYAKDGGPWAVYTDKSPSIDAVS